MKVSELTGAKLDYWVAQCNPPERAPGTMHRLVEHTRGETCYYVGSGSLRSIYNPSSNWEYGGPIIEREGIDLEAPRSHPDGWEAYYHLRLTDPYSGPTPLIAAMRAFVASKFGPEVPPKEEAL